ncbi:MAG: hypothetical protein PHI71_04585 [Acidiphilium sp.]|nr:hypothetical protein [Acidiphilium sp.]
MQNRNLVAVATVLIIAGVPQAFAARCPSSRGPAEQIACLHVQESILRAELANASLARQLARTDVSATGKRSLRLPSVVSIYGMARLQAVLEWQNGAGVVQGSIVVSPGDRIPGGWVVTAIAPNAVRIAKGHVAHTLLMAGGSAGGNSSVESPVPVFAEAAGGVGENGPTIPLSAVPVPPPGSDALPGAN